MAASTSVQTASNAITEIGSAESDSPRVDQDTDPNPLAHARVAAYESASMTTIGPCLSSKRVEHS